MGLYTVEGSFLIMEIYGGSSIFFYENSYSILLLVVCFATKLKLITLWSQTVKNSKIKFFQTNEFLGLI